MGTIRATPAYLSDMGADVSQGAPCYATDIANRLNPVVGTPFFVADLSGKSDYIPMAPQVDDDAKEDSAGVGGFAPVVAPNGGVAPYAYSWVVISSSGTFSYSLTNAASNPCSLSITPANPFTPAVVNLQCTVTDGRANAVASNVASFTYTSP